jgi:hypothetical protein
MEEQTPKRRSAAFREAARARARAQWTPEARAAQSELTRERMRSPSVREKIRLGMQESRAEQLQNLVLAWRRASAGVRERFVVELLTTGWSEKS